MENSVALRAGDIVHAIIHLNAKDAGSQKTITVKAMALGIIDSSP
jgi:hypothetical protein